MNSITRMLFGINEGENIINHDWDYLIILDACRCDIFKQVIRA